MYYELAIALRYTFSGAGDRFVSFVSTISIVGVALGVCALITVMSVMNGFQIELKDRILSVASHLEVISTDGKYLQNWDDLIQAYETHPEILAAAPNINQQGLLVNGSNISGAIIKGVLPKEEALVSDISDFSAIEEGFDVLSPKSYRIILGGKLARKLNVQPNDTLSLIAPEVTVTPVGMFPRMKHFVVAGYFSSGIHQYDESSAYIHLEDAQAVFRLTDAITSIRLKTDDVFNAPSIAKSLNELHVNTTVYDWTSSQKSLFRALSIERRITFILVSLIIAVAAFNIVSTLVTMVYNKRADVAILRVMGAKKGSIMKIFMLQGTMIGSIGTILGIIGGVLLASNISYVLRWLEASLGFDLFPGDVYMLEQLPAKVLLWDVTKIIVLSMLLTVLATLYPSYRAASMLPAKMLRHE